MLILLLDGLWNGITESSSAYENHVGASLYVAQPSTRNFIGAVSVLPRSTVDVVESVPGVGEASPVRTFLAVIDLHDRKVPTLVVGWVPGKQGGPWKIDKGRAPEAADEVVVGSVMAREHGLQVGAPFEMMGRTFRIVGTSADTFMLSLVFMTHEATDQLLQSPSTTSFVLVQSAEVATTRERLDFLGLTTLTPDEMASNDVRALTRPFGVPMKLMQAIATAIGILVISLTVYSGLVDRRREYGIVKALGATKRDLLGLTVEQSAMVAIAGLFASALFFVIARGVVEVVRPQFSVVLTMASVVRVVVISAVMAIVASVVPAVQLAAVEPSTAYRG